MLAWASFPHVVATPVLAAATPSTSPSLLRQRQISAAYAVSPRRRLSAQWPTGPMKAACATQSTLLKYSRMHAAARILGPMLAAAIDRLANEAPAEMLVVPVPLYRSKRAARGFNQARLLAIHAIQALRKTNPSWRLTLAPRALMRVRATRSQAGLTTRQRRQNLRGAFRVSDTSAVAGRHILVIDDIFTTGATARAAARALVNAGAAGVWVATLARARRLYSNSRNSSADLDLAQMRRGTPGSTLAGNSQIARHALIYGPTIFLTRG